MPARTAYTVNMKQRGWPDRRGMGAQSDFISEQFVPNESHKAQQKAMAETLRAAGLNPTEFDSLFAPEETVGMAKNRQSEPHLIRDDNLHRCSVCGYPFPADVRPSMSVTFAEHLLKAHPTRTDDRGLKPRCSPSRT